jgi:hypothetical protein
MQTVSFEAGPAFFQVTAYLYSSLFGEQLTV